MMKNSMELLLERSPEVRSYNPCSSEFYEQVKTAFKYMTLKYPEAQFFEPVDLFDENDRISGLKVSDLCSFGHNEFSRIEKEFNIKLPSDFTGFLKNFNEGFIITRNPIQMHNVDSIIELTRDIRGSYNTSESMPFNIIRFATVLGRDGLNVMLRRNGPMDRWRIATASYSTFSDEEMASSECEYLITDEDFDAWLTRIVSTDGAPLNPNVPDKEDDFLTERAR